MTKLTLNLDALSVDSFPTSAEKPAQKGTVQGNATGWACPITSGINSCWCTEFVSCDCV